MYEISVVRLIHVLDTLVTILSKAMAHADTKKIEPDVLTGSRLYPDMLPLARQIHIATDIAKGCAARLAGMDPPKFDDVEFTFPDLMVRLEKTINYLKTFKPEQIDGAEDRLIQWKTGGKELEMPGLQYLLRYVMPNVYFHASVTYSILRHNGIELGKRDFLGKIR
jgi:hypothetical protein